LLSAALPLCVLLTLVCPSRAAITITGFASGGENGAIASATIEDFEDVNLIPGLTIRMGGVPSPFSNRMWGPLPRVFNPSLAPSCCGIGGPYPLNAWDGVGALTNGGLGGTGATGVSPGDGQFFDFQFADSVVFVMNPPKQLFGVGLSNFQSLLSGDPPRTDHELIVNGVSRGSLESLLPGLVSGQYVKNRYLVITATSPDAIATVSIQNMTLVDGMVFDKVALRDFTSPTLPSTWGRLKSLSR
jgi:hypothetical protein